LTASGAGRLPLQLLDLPLQIRKLLRGNRLL